MHRWSVGLVVLVETVAGPAGVIVACLGLEGISADEATVVGFTILCGTAVGRLIRVADQVSAEPAQVEQRCWGARRY